MKQFRGVHHSISLNDCTANNKLPVKNEKNEPYCYAVIVL